MSMGRTWTSCLCLLLACALLAPDARAADGAVAAYGFDEGCGPTVADAPGNGNGGTVTNGAWAPGRNGQALNFAGATPAYVTIPDSPGLRLNTGMTLEAWVNPRQIGGANWRTVLFKQAAGSAMGWALYANNGGARPVAQLGIGGEQNAAGTAQLALNSWTHLASTYDGAMLRLYVN